MITDVHLIDSLTAQLGTSRISVVNRRSFVGLGLKCEEFVVTLVKIIVITIIVILSILLFGRFFI